MRTFNHLTQEERYHIYIMHKKMFLWGISQKIWGVTSPVSAESYKEIRASYTRSHANEDINKVHSTFSNKVENYFNRMHDCISYYLIRISLKINDVDVYVNTRTC